MTQEAFPLPFTHSAGREEKPAEKRRNGNVLYSSVLPFLHLHLHSHPLQMLDSAIYFELFSLLRVCRRSVMPFIRTNPNACSANAYHEKLRDHPSVNEQLTDQNLSKASLPQPLFTQHCLFGYFV